MASKIAKQAMAGAHTAGIYADMSVDGPEIGTLVVVLDRAKNLPNRKTMGKQDPYCACRLGKEAKKTETDRRGGQTPKWDQELRFTVHDSLDYHQLKVSVFNDDKKTDLVGETWVELDSVLKSGGGKNDLWHTLNCKGRYAGDIRIELTFYDSRPKDENAAETASIGSAPSQRERTPEAIGGPRQAKQVKRRPLPADPTSTDASPIRPTMPDHAQSSPLPYTPPRPQQGLHGPSPHSASASAHLRRFESSPAVNQAAVTPPEVEQYPTHYEEPTFPNNSSSYQRHSAPRDELYLPAEPSQPSYEEGYNEQQGQRVDNQLDYQQEPRPLPQHQPSNHYQGIDLPELPPHTPRTNRSSAHASPRYYTPANSSPTYTLPQYRTAPDSNRQWDARDGARFSEGHSPLAKGDYYQESPLRHHSFDDEDQSQSNTIYPSIEEDGPPPPPPTHRMSGHGLSSHREEPEYQNNYAPAPLNIRHPRASVSASPLAQTYTEIPAENYCRSVSPEEPRFSSRSAPTVPYQEPYAQPWRPSDRDSEPFPQHPHPYQTGRAYQESESYSQYNSYDNTPSPNQVQRHDARTGSGGGNVTHHDHRLSDQYGSGYENSLRRERASTYDSRHSYPLRPLDNNSQRYDDGQSPRSHRGSVPIIKPRAISPSPRTPVRKSVSPQPASAKSDGLSGVPFSPDSYDQLNPNLKNARSINSLGPRYTTPEGIREAARDREKEEKLASSGPIIDSKGRVVDPSDHLPSDTWAPEPERKTPRKTHEVKLKFRNSPHGPQSMPPRAPCEPAARPHSIATAPSPHHGPPPQQQQQHQAYQSPTVEDGSPTSAGRNRLQKRGARGVAPQPVHFHSSPVVPMGGHLPSPQQQQQQQQQQKNCNTLCEYPGYEYDGNGNASANGSPGYGRGARGNPPPVPAKVPLGARQEDWGRDSLSEEISRIDIGVGGDRRGMGAAKRGTGMGRFG